MIIDCNKAQKNGNLCLGYSGDTDEPCGICKNCIKCESGYYQLGETDKDNQLEQAKIMLKDIISSYNHDERFTFEKVLKRAEQFIGEENGQSN